MLEKSLCGISLVKIGLQLVLLELTGREITGFISLIACRVTVCLSLEKSSTSKIWVGTAHERYQKYRKENNKENTNRPRKCITRPVNKQDTQTSTKLHLRYSVHIKTVVYTDKQHKSHLSLISNGLV